MPKKEFWDLDELKDFVNRKGCDGLSYHVLDIGTEQDKQQAADILAKVRADLNTILIYIYRNPQLWMDKPIAFGIVHTLDIHIPCWEKELDSFIKKGDTLNHTLNLINKSCLSLNKLFNYQEMTPNDYGIIGLNKPKKIITIPTEHNGKIIDYEIAEKRSIFLTLRNLNTLKFNKYSTILDLAIHELTHTTCNDVRWKKDNHMPPYQSYHTLIRRWARDAGVLE